MAAVEGGSRQATALAVVDAPPRAPSPPPMAVNVWQYLNPPSPLPTPSDSDWEDDEDDMKLDKPASSKSTVASYQTTGYTYGSGPIPAAIARFDSFYGKSTDAKETSAFETPAPRKTRNGKQAVVETSSALVKRSTKRKRAHVDDLDLSKSGPSDVVMKDAGKDTPAAHSGLTGGIKGLWSRAFLPSPEDTSPTSPVKHSRADQPGHRRGERRVRHKSDSDREKEDRKRKKHKSSDEKTKEKEKDKDRKHHEKRASRKRSRSPGVTKQRALSLSPATRHPQKKQMKAIEYQPSSDSVAPEDLSKALVPTKKHEVHHAPTTKSVDTFLSCLVKGAEKEEGVSFQKALQRWNRHGGTRTLEKELWKELKVRCNENGELVICI